MSKLDSLREMRERAARSDAKNPTFQRAKNESEARVKSERMDERTGRSWDAVYKDAEEVIALRAEVAALKKVIQELRKLKSVDSISKRVDTTCPACAKRRAAKAEAQKKWRKGRE